MKKDIHPRYYPEATVACVCGNTWTTGSTLEELRVDVCNKCHPYFSGQAQRLIDRGGQVERFNKRVEVAQVMREEEEKRAAARKERARARALVEIVDEEEIEPIERLDLADEEDAEAGDE